MPTRKKTGVNASISSASANRDDEEYRLKRKRNNDAVKKTRAKSKETANERKKRVEKLKEENRTLEAKIGEKKMNIETLKDLLITSKKTEDQERELKRILEENTDDDDDIME